MSFRDSTVNPLFFVLGCTLLLFALFVDPSDVLQAIGFPARKLYGSRGQGDLAIIRILLLVTSVFLISFQLLIWKSPGSVLRKAAAIKNFAAVATRSRFSTWLFLGMVVLVKSSLQLSLYLLGYEAYAGDDFSRSLKADDWLRHLNSNFDLAAWLNIGGPQLPFPDFLFGFALGIYRDVYVTPKIVNLFLSGIAVFVVYRLGCDLFGRSAGLFSAVLFAFQPWIVWLGISGMTSDLPSVIALALFGLFLHRWFEINRAVSLFAAAGWLFVACGMRYENWLFAIIFSLVIAWKFISAMRRGEVNIGLTGSVGGALLIVIAFPVFYMAASYFLLGDLLPALEKTDSFRATNGAPVAKVSIIFLALSAFPLEIAVILAGIGLFLMSDTPGSARLYLLIIAMTLLSFVIVFKGRLPIHGAGPERILLPYFTLCLPFAGYFLTRVIGRVHLNNNGVMFAVLLLGTFCIFDVARAFNYPKNKFNREAFTVGWMLRMLQGVGEIAADGQIIYEGDKKDRPFPFLAVANKPERFRRLGEAEIGMACKENFKSEECRSRIFDGTADILILSSAEKIKSFRQGFRGRSWPIGQYSIFELQPFADRRVGKMEPRSNQP